MRKDIIEKVEKFLWYNLEKSIGYEDNNQRSVEYRFEHSWRVANIGRMIALEEGLDVERLVVACLLHDIGYSLELKTPEEHKSHGRYGAKIARPFLLELGYSKEEVEEMCYGIAIHVDSKSDFEHENTPLALSVADADNIDRFDAYRLYENLHMADYMNLPIEKQKEFVQKRITRLKELREYKFGTKTGQKLWQGKVDYQIDFYKKLENQINNSSIKSMFNECGYYNKL